MSTYINRGGILFDPITRAAVGICTADGAEAVGFTAPVVAVASSRTLTPADSGKTLECTAAVTLTVPAGLRGFVCSIIPFGTTGITSDGTALLNAATATLTRAASSNALVQLVQRGSASNSFVVSGT